MRVVFLRSNPVDPDSRVEKEVNSLLKVGIEVDILAWDRSNQYKIKESYLNLPNGKAKIYRFGIPATFGGGIKSNLMPLIKFQLRLLQWLNKHKKRYNIIHACDFDTASTAFMIAKLHKKKIIYDIFDYYVDSFKVPKYLKRFIENRDHRIINNADAVIICSDKRKEQIKGTYPKKLEVIHNSPANNSDNTVVKFKLNESKIKIVYVGILAAGRFIKEIADFVKENPEYEFHIGGFGKFESYFKNLSDNYENIIFYGKLPYNKTLELEKCCDIMVAIYDPKIPNHYYAAPNKFYEALMLGKPLIMAKNTGMDEIVTQYEIGEVIEYNSQSFKQALEKLVSRRDKWDSISLKMKNLYRKEYSWEEMERRLLNIYKDYIN